MATTLFGSVFLLLAFRLALTFGHNPRTPGRVSEADIQRLLHGVMEQLGIARPRVEYPAHQATNLVGPQSIEGGAHEGLQHLGPYGNIPNIVAELTGDNIPKDFSEDQGYPDPPNPCPVGKTEGANYRNILDKAVQADKQVKERYQSHRETISLLCKPEQELNAAIPSANPAKTMQGSEVVNVLRSLLSNLDEVKREREQLENDLKSVNFDMTSKFLTALAQDGAVNEEAVSVTELDRLYGSLTHKVQESLKKQEELLNSIQNSHQEFSKMKQSNNESNLREEVLKNLAVANDNFVELVANLKEGTKFYNELTEILLKFQNKCSDIVFARKTERDELLKDLQQSIAREPSAPSFPSVPAYQTGPAGGNKPPASSAPTPAPRTMVSSKPQPPARPPPPVILTANTVSAPPPAASGTTGVPASSATSTAHSQAQGPPYPTYPGYPGYCQMPLPMGYNPYMYGQYNVPYTPSPVYQNPGQAPYPGPQQPGYPYPQQPGYPYPQQ